MKKLFAIFFGIITVFSSANAVTCKIQELTFDYYEPISSCTTKNNNDNSQISLDFLYNYNVSWDELATIASLMPEVSISEVEQEDYYVLMLINCINRSINRNAEYIHGDFGGTISKKLNYNRLMQKYQAIIDIFNETHNTKISWHSEILNNIFIKVIVTSTN